MNGEWPDSNLPSRQELLDQLHTQYPIIVIDQPENERIAEVARLDAELFGVHKSLTETEFRDIVQQGGVILGHVGENGELVSEASIVLHSNPEGASNLEKRLPGWLAYCDGAAVSQDYRGKGMQKELLAARELIAHEAKKDAIAASVRQRNLPSITSMLGVGYVMLADAPGYYGSGEEHDRVVMLKDFASSDALVGVRQSLKGISQEDIKGSPEDIKRLIEQNEGVIGLPVTNSDEIDSTYNQMVRNLLNAGYIGVDCRPLESDGQRETDYAMVFVQIQHLPKEAAVQIRDRQREVRRTLA